MKPKRIGEKSGILTTSGDTNYLNFNNLLQMPERETASLLTMYPAIRNNVAIHITPTYGMMYEGSPPEISEISKGVCEFLLLCNGSLTMDEILSKRLKSKDRGSDSELAAAITGLVNLIRSETIQLYSEPEPAFINVTGSREAYFPTHLQIELTTQCNLKCGHCYRRADEDGPDTSIPFEHLISILNDLRQLGLRSVELTGGEPLLHRDFNKILTFCGERFFLVGLLTNGTLITEAGIQTWLPFKDKMVLSISLDGSTAKLHDNRRGLPGSFEKTTGAFRLMKKHEFICRAAMTVDDVNWHDIEPTLLHAKKSGASLFSYTPILPLGRARKNFRFWETDAETITKDANRLAISYEGFLHTIPEDTIQALEKSDNCGAGHRTYAVDPRGRIRPCVTFDENQGMMGTMLETSYQSVFGSELAFLNAKLRPPTLKSCESCQWAIFCRNCALRASIASHWPGVLCSWLENPDNKRWHELINT